jgi:O-methyltransferase
VQSTVLTAGSEDVRAKARDGLLSKAIRSAALIADTLQSWRLYRKHRRNTMTHGTTYISNLLLARSVLDVPGCVVECGVWRGGMIAGIAEVLGPDRDYFLFDSFEGLPKAQQLDGESMAAWQRNVGSTTYFDNCRASEDEARTAMQMAGVPRSVTVKGWFERTVPSFKPPSPIALLRLDGDLYESTKVCLESLYEHVAANGLIVIDDYGTWEGCARAVNEFLAGTSEHHVLRLREYANRVFYIVKDEGSNLPANWRWR